MPVSTYYAVASRSYNDGYWVDDSLGEPYPHIAFDIWANDTGLGQGSYTGEYQGYFLAVYGPWRGTLYFGAGSDRPTQLSGKVIDSARLRLTRYDDSPPSGNSAAVTTTVYATNLTSVHGAGARDPNGQTIGSGITSPAMTKGETVWFNIPAALWNAVIAGKCLCLYTGTGRLSRHCGIESTSYKPAIEFTWHEPIPAPTAPSISAINTITDDPHLFNWADASDPAGYYTSAELMYEFQFSADGGSSWSSTITTSEGVSQQLFDIKTFLVLAAEQYYYNNNCKIRVRTKTPLWPDELGIVYYSGWSVSTSFTVDYRIAPKAPSSLTPSKTDTYEGEAITFTVGRLPEGGYNTHDHNGAVMDITYSVELVNGTVLARGSADVLGYTVGELTEGLFDLATTIRTKATDAEGQISPYLTDVGFTVRRFRKPLATATISARASTTAIINVVVQDTGYGGTQRSTQINKIQYKGVPGAVDWTDATLNDSWGGSPGSFTNTFGLIGLAAGTQYTLLIRAVNNPPDETGLSGLNGMEYTREIHEYLPRLASFKRTDVSGDQASAGGYAQAMIIGDNPNIRVNQGSLNVQCAIDAGETLRCGGKDVVTKAAGAVISGHLLAANADGDAVDSGMALSGTDSKVITGTPGASGNLAMWNADGDLIDSGISGSNGSWNGAGTVTWSNGWADYGGSYAFGYSRDSNDVIHLRGLIKSGAIGSAAFTLPAGYRPASVAGYYPCATSGYGSAVVQILSTGVVTPVAGNTAWIALSGISFR